MIIRIVKYIFIVILLFLMQCKSADIISYKNSDSLKGSTVKEMESDDKIDQGRTYEVFFILKNDEDCIKISIASQVFDESINKNISLKTYYILEKLIDLSKFKGSGKKIQYSELGRNYDYNWNAKGEIETCTAESPIMRLNKDDKFRIRFTIFRDKNFQYNITIFSKNGINVTDMNFEKKE